MGGRLGSEYGGVQCLTVRETTERPVTIDEAQRVAAIGLTIKFLTDTAPNVQVIATPSVKQFPTRSRESLLLCRASIGELPALSRAPLGPVAPALHVHAEGGAHEPVEPTAVFGETSMITVPLLCEGLRRRHR